MSVVEGTVALSVSLPDEVFSGFNVEKQLTLDSAATSGSIVRTRSYTTLPPAQTWDVAEYGIVSSVDPPDLSDIARPVVTFQIDDYSPNGSAALATCARAFLGWQRGEHETTLWLAAGAPESFTSDYSRQLQ